MSGHTDRLERKYSGRLACHILIMTALVALLAAAGSSPLDADEIYFKSGYSRTAVVLSETDAMIKFKTEMGISTISREKVDFVEKATPQENQLLLRKWREKELKEEEAREAKREAERRFDEAQRAKGLIQFEEKWMTPKERDEILDIRSRAKEHRRRFEAEQQAKGLVTFQNIWVTPEQASELRRMEPEIYRLYDQIATQRKTLGALRSAMLNVASVEEAEKFSKRIEEIDNSVAENSDKLGKLLDRADEISAMGVRYVPPEEFRGAFAPAVTQ
ncbi:hypothetical protein HZA56_07710 [Candidatus Poribacteria bacterium]|nr:hypothetical protein [Candidatus Poribacteria bacterium]